MLNKFKSRELSYWNPVPLMTALAQIIYWVGVGRVGGVREGVCFVRYAFFLIKKCTST